jgi:hypothetical protein
VLESGASFPATVAALDQYFVDMTPDDDPAYADKE